MTAAARFVKLEDEEDRRENDLCAVDGDQSGREVDEAEGEVHRILSWRERRFLMFVLGRMRIRCGADNESATVRD